jgi:hypothetical protein
MRKDREQRPTQEAWDKALELVCGKEIHPQHFAVPRVARFIDALLELEGRMCRECKRNTVCILDPDLEQCRDCWETEDVRRKRLTEQLDWIRKLARYLQ